jgi:quinol monooxygenase YgiN
VWRTNGKHNGIFADQQTQSRGMIHVIATIELREGMRERFLAIVRDNLPHVRAEDGCLEYEPTVDLPTDHQAQLPLRPRTVTIVEKWRDLAALRAHLQAPHMLAYREKVKSLVQSVSLQVLEPA